ncbi:ctf13p [Saccharomyces arboricola H-6]|uniref:Ctf13p n=1 Tax=Saccharomyces arboricola (strain H-6 / AS 2.3317 / CBS 10644) TaxID=1160507 RepID=J8Q455_SACAR|nr:ctf13p [Saccharomyces arboricola H-6]
MPSFNPVRFLDLPIDIRKEVYFHLDGDFCGAHPCPIDVLYSSNTVELPGTPGYKRSKRSKKLLKYMYPVFASHLSIFEYSPPLIEEWLEYAFWLRYDCLVLDCLKVNHLYDGSLIGALEWTYLDNELRLAYFNKASMLEVWYTFKEYKKWVIESAACYEFDSNYVSNIKFDIENLTPQTVYKCLSVLEKKDLLSTLRELQFGQDEEVREEDDDDEAGSDQYAKSKSTVIRKKRASPRSSHPDADRVKGKQKQLTNMSVTSTIKMMELMKSLRKITVRGEKLYELLINFHGFRDNPGKTISYIVKRRINEIQLSRMEQISRTGLADFTRWDNLQAVILSRIAYVDLNNIVFPKNFKSLTMKRVDKIKWWNIEESILKELKLDKKIFRKLYIREDKSRFTKFLNLCQTKIKELDKSEIDQIKYFRCQALVWHSFGTLNHIKLQNISEVRNNNIIVPRALFDSKRVEIFQCEKISEVLVI